MSLVSLLSIHQVDIQIVSVTRGGAGGILRVWTAVSAGVRCRVSPLPPEYMVDRLGKEGFRPDYKVYFPDNPNIDERNRLLFTDSDVVQHILLVEKIENPHELDKFWKVWCVELKDVEGTAA